MAQGVLLDEGKTKIIRQDSEDSSAVLIESKDDITAGDGAKRDQLEGKAAAATATTCNVFELLQAKGIPTHYLGQVDDRVFRAYRVEMLALELVARRVATGSYLKRNPSAMEGEIFDDLVFEIFHKDDDAHDPILSFDFERGVAVRYPANEPVSTAQPIDALPLASLKLGLTPDSLIATLRRTTESVFKVLEAAWAEEDVQLVDLKIECGWAGDELVVADVIDNDSWRIWPGGDKAEMKDKQVYRDLADTDDAKAKAKELGKIKENYQWVAEATGAFVGARSS